MIDDTSVVVAIPPPHALGPLFWSSIFAGGANYAEVSHASVSEGQSYHEAQIDRWSIDTCGYPYPHLAAKYHIIDGSYHGLLPQKFKVGVRSLCRDVDG